MVKSSPFDGFLPKEALVMARRLAPSSGPVPGPRLGVVLSSPLAKAESANLFKKMMHALGLEETQYCVLDESTKHDLGRFAVLLFMDEDEAGGDRATAEAPGKLSVRTYHPELLLRKPALKKKAWGHLQAFARAAGLAIPGKSKPS